MSGDPRPERRRMMGSGWKMNHSVADTVAYANGLAQALNAFDHGSIDLFVLPPFTALAAAQTAFADTGVSIGGQNMHWDERGAWTGEISGTMLRELGCQWVALAHSERLAHFGETYELVHRKVKAAVAVGLNCILCLGETAEERDRGAADATLTYQLDTALEGRSSAELAQVVLAYEPRWAINGSAAASPAYIAERHRWLRACVAKSFGAVAAEEIRVLYGGSVSLQNAPALLQMQDVDGLFVGRSAWTASGYAELARLVAATVGTDVSDGLSYETATRKRGNHASGIGG